MRSILLTLLLLAVSSTSLSPQEEERREEFNEEFISQIQKSDNPRGEGLLKVLRKNEEMKNRLWVFQRVCRAQKIVGSNDTEICTIPLHHETCFGMPIDYRYVPSRTSMPVQYEVLKRFPKCWKYLAPAMCGLIYRPCDVQPFLVKLPSKNEKAEFWQRFGIGACRKVHEVCEDAIKEGFFPSELVDCKRTVQNVTWRKQRANVTGALASFVPSGDADELVTEWERQTVFTEDNCQIRYTENASRHEPMQCIFPLVYTQHERIRPVIDQCFLPCRSPLISSPNQFLSFRVIRALLCLLFAALCLFTFVFLSARSKIFLLSDSIFSIACCLLCISFYLACWGLGSISYFAHSSECTHTVDGVDIRSSPIDHFASSWCLISAVVSHSSLLASIGFLAAAFPLSVGGATKIRRREDEKTSDGSAGLRASLVTLICIVSIVWGIVSVFLKMVSTDGVAGVCSFGLHSITHHLAALAVPGLVFCLAALGVGIWKDRRETKGRQAEIEYAIGEKIRERIEKEKANEKVKFWKDRGPGQKEEIQSIVRQGSLPPVEEKDGESGRGSGGGEIERDGEEEVLVLQGDDDEEKQWLSEDEKRSIAATVRLEMGEEWKGWRKKAWYEGISTRYTLVALILCILSLLIGLAVHWATLANSGKEEYDAVREYVKCVMNKSIASGGHQEWLSEPGHAAEWWNEGRAESDPLARRHNLASGITIHACSFPSTGDGRIVGLLLVFIALPLLPVVVFLYAFAIGYVGAGGMMMVRERRPKKQKRRDYDDDDDVEMTGLTSKRDGNSQMMSSVASSLDGRLVPRPAGSTVSTRVSSTSRLSAAGSSASSTRSSVSLRGRLPRFPSAERLMTVRATSPVPSVARSEVVVAPERRSRSVEHHRRLDIVARAKERKKQIWNKKTRASSAEIEARREGRAESGQLVAPRNSIDHDARSVSSHSTTRTQHSGVSSSLHPPSQVAAEMRRNAEELMRRSRPPTDARNAGLLQQFQMVQEEMLRRTQPNDQPSSSFINQYTPEWFRNLEEVRLRLEACLRVSNAASPGLMLSGHALNLGRTIINNGAQDFETTFALQYALGRLQELVYHLEAGLDVPPQLETDIQRSTERILLLAAGLQQQQLMQQQMQQLQPMQQAPPEYVYAPMRTINWTQPPSNLGAGSSYSLTNSTVPSSSLTTTAEQEARRLRLNQEIHDQPPGYEGAASISGAAATAAASAAAPSTSAAAAAAGNAAADGHNFIASILRANPQVQAVYAAQSAHFPAPTSSELDNSHDDDDPMSSETSMDSIGRRLTPAASTFSAGAFGVPIFDVRYGAPSAAPAARQRDATLTNGGAPNSNVAAAPGTVPRNLFPFVRTDELPPIPSFPGASPMVSPSPAPSSSSQPPTTHEEQRRAIGQAYHDHWREQRAANGAPAMNGLDGEEEKRKEEGKGEKRRTPLSDDEPSCSARRRNNDDPPPRVGMVRVLGDGDVNGVAAAMQNQARNSLPVAERRDEEDGLADDDDDDDDGDSGLDSNLSQPSSVHSLGLYVTSSHGEAMRRATPQEQENYERAVRGVQEEVEDRFRRRGLPRRDEDEAGPSNGRQALFNRYLNHSDPDLAMEEEAREQRAEEERERERRRQRREADDEREEEERRRVERARRERIHREARVQAEEDEDSIGSLLTPEEQADLVRALRNSLARRPTEGMSEDERRLVHHLTLALDTQGGISREEIMRFRVYETNRENRARQQPGSPYSVSTVVISRMSLAEIGARADAIRRLSAGTMYPLEVYYQLHLADVLWPLAGRDVMMGDNVYTHDEINRVLGADSPLVPAGADSADFHQLMRKRAITAASLTGRAYGNQRGSQGSTYQPPRLPDQGIYRLLGDPSVILAAIDGDLQPIRDAIRDIPLTMPDVMRLDDRSESTLGAHLRQFRDFLDARASAAGFPLRDDTYAHDDVPQEPTDPSRPREEDGDPSGPQPDPDGDPDF